jgi:hypothetical protein
MITSTPACIDSTNWAALSDAQRVKHLEIEGYVVLPGLLSAGQVADMKRELARLPTKGMDYSENQRTCNDVQWTDSPVCVDVIALPAMTGFLEKLFGDEIVCTSCTYALSRPGHPGMAIHTDAQPYGSAIFGMQASAPRLVRALYYLDDLTPERAPLKVIPHSHLSLHADGNPYKRYASHPEEVAVLCQAGSAAIINQTVFHANYPNRSGENRELLAIGYRPAWAGPIAEVPEWPAEQVTRLPSHVGRYFTSRNTRVIDFNVRNRAECMATAAPGINPSRWEC